MKRLRQAASLLGVFFLIALVALGLLVMATAKPVGNSAVLADPAGHAATPPVTVPPSTVPPGTVPPSTVPPVPSNTLEFGTLVTLPDHAKQESAAGVKNAMLELQWDQYEPSNGHFDQQYAASVRSQLQAFTAAGQHVTLAFGLHSTPNWVTGLPDARPIDGHGKPGESFDMVFSQPARDAVAQYFARINSDLGLSNFTYVRLTAGGNAEILYSTGDSYAAFSAAAQNGPNMATGMPKNPAPGWKPGTRNIPPAQVRAWADWYVGALDNVVNWQMKQLDSLGFRGVYQMLTPGSGVRPSDYDQAIASYLPDGLLGVGAAWQPFYAGLKGKPRVMVYVSSVADGSGNDDMCSAADAKVALTDGSADSWSATRWESRLATEYGFTKGGENPGFGDAADSHYGDASAKGLMALSLRQTQTCGLQVFYWAHDDQLWGGAASFQNYAKQIAAL